MATGSRFLRRVYDDEWEVETRAPMTVTSPRIIMMVAAKTGLRVGRLSTADTIALPF